VSGLGEGTRPSSPSASSRNGAVSRHLDDQHCNMNLSRSVRPWARDHLLRSTEHLFTLVDRVVQRPRGKSVIVYNIHSYRPPVIVYIVNNYRPNGIPMTRSLASSWNDERSEVSPVLRPSHVGPGDLAEPPKAASNEVPAGGVLCTLYTACRLTGLCTTRACRSGRCLRSRRRAVSVELPCGLSFTLSTITGGRKTLILSRFTGFPPALGSGKRLLLAIFFGLPCFPCTTRSIAFTVSPAARVSPASCRFY
jgi:hypothetical protein